MCKSNKREVHMNIKIFINIFYCKFAKLNIKKWILILIKPCICKFSWLLYYYIIIYIWLKKAPCCIFRDTKCIRFVGSIYAFYQWTQSVIELYADILFIRLNSVGFEIKNNSEHYREIIWNINNESYTGRLYYLVLC